MLLWVGLECVTSAVVREERLTECSHARCDLVREAGPQADDHLPPPVPSVNQELEAAPRDRFAGSQLDRARVVREAQVRYGGQWIAVCLRETTPRIERNTPIGGPEHDRILVLGGHVT